MTYNFLADERFSFLFKENITVTRDVWEAYDDTLPDTAWRFRKRKIDPQKLDVAGFVYVLAGYDPETGRFACYIGSTTAMKKANSYWGSGAQLDRVFPKRDWMERHIIEFVRGSEKDVLQAEYEHQMQHMEEIILDNNWHDGGEFLNLIITSPYGDEPYHHHSIVRPGNLGGAKSPVMVQYSWNQSPIYYASQKELCEKYGWGSGTVVNWMVLKGSTATRKIYAADNTSFELRKRNPKKTWEDKGIDWIRYATAEEIEEFGNE